MDDIVKEAVHIVFDHPKSLARDITGNEFDCDDKASSLVEGLDRHTNTHGSNFRSHDHLIGFLTIRHFNERRADPVVPRCRKSEVDPPE